MRSPPTTLTAGIAIGAPIALLVAGAALAKLPRMRQRTLSHLRVVAAAVAVIAVATACQSPPVETPRTETVQDNPFPWFPDNKVDVLFMIDNSSSMEPMQAQLRARFPQFLQVFDELAAKGFYVDLHIGVVTSDYGAGKSDGPSAMPGQPYCGHSPGGDLGLLQRKGRAATNCQGLPDDGPPYISYVYAKDGGSNNLPAGQSLADTFTCMASVGALGCGFEHQLESVYQALKNGKENAGFVRDDALLAVVFVTNEDDGSAPPDTMIFSSDKSLDGMYGAYDTYRQTRFGVACGSPLMLAPYAASGGPLADCEPAPNTPLMAVGGEYDVERYKQLFKLPIAQGGLKVQPDDDLLLFAIDGPETPFQTVNVRQQTVPSARYADCGGATDCVIRLQRSCINAIDDGFFADPAVRLNDVVRSVRNSTISSICGDDPKAAPDFSHAMQTLAANIITHLPGCIPRRVEDPADPQCLVVQRSVDDKGQPLESVIPSCLHANGTFPCWRAVTKDQCTGPQRLGMEIDRNGAPAPPSVHMQVECSTVAEK